MIQIDPQIGPEFGGQNKLTKNVLSACVFAY